MSARRLGEESGYSLVEVLIAILVLSIGVIGSFALVDTANRKTSQTKAREGATNLARDLVETARTVPFNNITQAELEAALSARSGLADSDDANGWQVKRRDLAYTVEYTVCTVDDASDRLAASHGSAFCPGTQDASSPSGADRNPVDFMRVVFKVSWTDGRTRHEVQQSGLVNSTYRGPAVKTLAGPASIFTGSTAAFSAMLDSSAQNVKWYVDGRPEGDARGSGTTWEWEWDIGPATCPTPPDAVQDGNYFVSAAAYDRNGSTGGPKASAVSINRCPPSAPSGVAGGRNWNSVELTWAANPESDVLGYSVFRGNQAVCSAEGAAQTSCRDTNAPSSGTLLYTVVAYDTGPSGRRAGDASSPLTVLPECGSAPCNTPPKAPAVSISGSTLTITPASPEDDDEGDSVALYRIYRTTSPAQPTSPSERYDVIDSGAGSVTWTDSSPGDYRYWVTAVDEHYSESPFAEARP